MKKSIPHSFGFTPESSKDLTTFLELITKLRHEMHERVLATDIAYYITKTASMLSKKLDFVADFHKYTNLHNMSIDDKCVNNTIVKVPITNNDICDAICAINNAIPKEEADYIFQLYCRAVDLLVNFEHTAFNMHIECISGIIYGYVEIDVEEEKMHKKYKKLNAKAMVDKAYNFTEDIMNDIKTSNDVNNNKNIKEKVIGNDFEGADCINTITSYKKVHYDADINEIFDEMMSDTDMNYYAATAVKLLIDTKDLPVFYTSKAANEAIDLLIKWREQYADNHECVFHHKNPREFAAAIFETLEDSRALAVVLIIMSVSTSDNDLSGIYLDAAIGILNNECIIREDKYE